MGSFKKHRSTIVNLSSNYSLSHIPSNPYTRVNLVSLSQKMVQKWSQKWTLRNKIMSPVCLYQVNVNNRESEHVILPKKSIFFHHCHINVRDFFGENHTALILRGRFEKSSILLFLLRLRCLWFLLYLWCLWCLLCIWCL